ncbi:hypothetical protein M0R45_017843 [Rubus argutus]|uniref:Uncharacterized protein n=1 Tax=Rubus argutus TaxID=59490 RepID=A0AAW1XXN4_RUBAR
MYPNRRRKAPSFAAPPPPSLQTTLEPSRSDQICCTTSGFSSRQISVVNAYTVEPSSPHRRRSPSFLSVAAPIRPSPPHGFTTSPCSRRRRYPKSLTGVPATLLPAASPRRSLSDGMMKR